MSSIKKIVQSFLVFLCLVFLNAAFEPVRGSSEFVGAILPGEKRENIAAIQQTEALSIDYDSFRWVVLPKQALAQLESQDLEYQVIENPYRLTLGGESFDPLVQTLPFAAAWGEKPISSSPALHLVQFQGPIKSEWVNQMKINGLDVLQYIHPFTYVVWGDSIALEKTAANAHFRWSGNYLPAYAVLPENRSLGNNSILFRMMVYPGADLARIEESIGTLGGRITHAAQKLDPIFEMITFEIPGDQIQTIATFPGVYTIQPVPTNGGDRGEMSNQVNVYNVDPNNRAFIGYQSWLDQLGLSGQGVIIANVDSGIDQNHPDLTNRILPCTGMTCGGDTASNHGTHTAGIMAGDGSSGFRDTYGFLRGLGMAPGANLIEQVYNPTYLEPNGMLTLISESSQNNAVLSGNSWGPSSTALGYDLDTRLVDIGVRDAEPAKPGNQPLNYILSIMNGYGGTSTQGTPDEAKNTFTIGSTLMQYSTGTQNLNINNISSNSAHGPALDGRIIPHLVAPGCYVDSTTTDAFYSLMCGTSMASPQVSGAAALFIERYRNMFSATPSPALVKAAFLPVAHDLAGYFDADGNLLGHPFDAKQGWGRLDASKVLDPPGSALYYDQPVILHNSGETWRTSLTLTEPIGGLRAMLVWTDAPGHGLGGTTPAWVNNLDLSLSYNGQTYFGNNFGLNGLSLTDGMPDRMNNTEGIFLPGLAPGEVTLTVIGVNISGDGVPNLGDDTDQDFALVVYLLPNPPTFTYIFPIFFYNNP